MCGRTGVPFMRPTCYIRPARVEEAAAVGSLFISKEVWREGTERSNPPQKVSEEPYALITSSALSCGSHNRRARTAMVAGHSFAEFLREQLAPVGRVTMRRGRPEGFAQADMGIRQVA